MSIFKSDKVDVSKIKPQPYESFEEAERKREEAATEVNDPLTEKQKAYLREHDANNPISQLVDDTIELHPDLPPPLEDKENHKP